MAVEMVRCSNGHRFPVNKSKHKNRTYVICPHRGCHERVQIRKRRLSFNLKWSGIKADAKESRLEAKEKKRGQRGQPPQILPGITRIGMSRTLATALAFSAAMKKAEEEEKKSEHD